jgi:L-malate glycosyltransferase
MKILHTVEFYWPHMGGAQEVVRQVSEHLVKRGHEVTVATSRLSERKETVYNGVKIKEFSVSGNEVRGFQGEVQSYQNFLRGEPFDVMMNYAAQQWTSDLAFPLLAVLPFKKILAACGFSGLTDSAYQDYFSRMPAYLKKYDRLIFHSETYQDACFAKDHGISRYTVIPNGASEEEFLEEKAFNFRERYRIGKDTPFVLAVSNHEQFKGHKLVIEAFRRARIGRAVLVIMGRSLSLRGCLPSCHIQAAFVRTLSFGRKRVLLLNAPRREVVGAFRSADLFVHGSQLECSPLVLFESMASKTPFITTDSGNAKEIVAWGNGGVVLSGRRAENGRVITEQRTLSKSIEEMIAQKNTRVAMGESGYEAWRDRFTWNHISGVYEALYQSLLNE